MSEPVASARNLSKRFGTKDALIDITAEIEQGDVIGVLGKNGAGKTTLLEVLLGFSPPSAGTAMIFGEDSLRLSEAAKARIGFVPQQDELLGMLSGKQQVAIGAVFHKRWDHALIDRLLVDWEVPTDRRIHTLSVGERQKLSVPQGVEVAIIIYPVGALTAIVLAMLVFTGQPNWIWIGLPLLSGFMQWMSAGGPAHLREAGVSLPWIVAVASVGARVVFATWYLRARYVRPVLRVATADSARSAWPWGAAALPSELTRAVAVRMLLAGHVQRPLAQQLLIAAGIGALLCLVAPLLQYLPGQQTTTPPFTRFLWPFYAMVIMAFGTHPLVRQSRFLWLRVPGARGEVLKLVERMVARLYARVAVAIVAFVLFALWVLGTPLGEAAWGVHSCARPRCIRRAWVLPRCATSGSWSWA